MRQSSEILIGSSASLLCCQKCVVVKAVRNGSLKIIGCACRMLGQLTTCTCFLSQVSFVLQHFLGKNACLGIDYGLSV